MPLSEVWRRLVPLSETILMRQRVPHSVLLWIALLSAALVDVEEELDLHVSRHHVRSASRMPLCCGGGAYNALEQIKAIAEAAVDQRQLRSATMQ